MKNPKHGLRKNHSQEKLRFYFKRKQGQLTLVLIALLVLISIIPVRLAVALHLAAIPQAVFVLGSDSDRSYFGSDSGKCASRTKHQQRCEVGKDQTSITNSEI